MAGFEKFARIRYYDVLKVRAQLACDDCGDKLMRANGDVTKGVPLVGDQLVMGTQHALGSTQAREKEDRRANKNGLASRLQANL